MKYTGFLIQRNTKYTDGNGNDLAFQPSFTESAIDAMYNSHNYVFVELYKKVGEVAANTKKALNEAAYNTGLYFDEIYIVPNK